LNLLPMKNPCIREIREILIGYQYECLENHF
jgi:hypothetical protein